MDATDGWEAAERAKREIVQAVAATSPNPADMQEVERAADVLRRWSGKLGASSAAGHLAAAADILDVVADEMMQCI